MKPVITIAANTIREAVRDKVLYLFLSFAAALLVVSKVFGILTVGDEAKVIKDLGLVAIQFFSMLIAVMMGLLLISREIENRTVFNILAKPVSRWQFLLGKYLGLVAVVAINLALMTGLLVLMVWVYTGGIDLMLIFAAAMTMLEMMVLAAFATLFAVVTTPMLGSLMTFSVFVVGHVSADLWMLTKHLKGSVVRVVIAVVYYLVPNLERFDFRTEVVHGVGIPPGTVGWAVLYAAAYSALILLLANLRFRRKDLM